MANVKKVTPKVAETKEVKEIKAKKVAPNFVGDSDMIEDILYNLRKE